jgi:hypothetical protein
MNDLRLIALLCIRTLATSEAAALVPTITRNAHRPSSLQESSHERAGSSKETKLRAGKQFQG